MLANLILKGTFFMMWTYCWTNVFLLSFGQRGACVSHSRWLISCIQYALSSPPESWPCIFEVIWSLPSTLFGTGSGHKCLPKRALLNQIQPSVDFSLQFPVQVPGPWVIKHRRKNSSWIIGKPQILILQHHRDFSFRSKSILAPPPLDEESKGETVFWEQPSSSSALISPLY